MIRILTIFPESLEIFKARYLEVEIIDLRTYAKGSYRHIDENPYGGGAGMVLRYDVLHEALVSLRKENTHVILLTPIGDMLNQDVIANLRRKEDVLLICGHYEGVDARIYEEVDQMLSVGDYILSGGEVAALLFLETILNNGVK
ncbi:MAG: hypothetical protein J6D29_04900 [Solobacterium sp.]|nr:hypothetical protein [Solobacterium sp.]